MNGVEQRTGRLLALVALAAALNLYAIPLAPGAGLILGPFVYLPLVMLLPTSRAALAALVALLPTLASLGHPFALVIGTLEAAWLGWSRRITTRSIIQLDLLFWAVLGLPLMAFFQGQIADRPTEVVVTLVLLQLMTRLAAATGAAFLVRHSPLPEWLGLRPPTALRMREVVFQAVFALAAVPILLVGFGLTLLIHGYAENEERHILNATAQRLSQQLDLFIETHQAALNSVAAVLSRQGGDPQALLAETYRAHPGFITMLVADAGGIIRQAAPVDALSRVRGTSVAAREYFTAARDLERPYVSGVFRGRGFGNDTIIALSAPWFDARGQFAGIVQASLEVRRFAELIAGHPDDPALELVFADADGRTIFADPRSGIPALARIVHFPQGELLARPNLGERFEFDSVQSDGKRKAFVATAAKSERYGFVVMAQMPFLAAVEGVGWIYLLMAVVLGGVLVMAAVVARVARRRIAAPLEIFAHAANRQAARQNVEPIADQTPDAPYEIGLVFRAFNQLAVQLQGTYQRLRQTNAELDQRVADRTRELEIARRAAEAASHSKTDFLAMTSHEIRTPLNAIIGLAEAVEERTSDPTSVTRLQTIRNSGLRLVAVVNDLLDLSRVEAGKLELREAPVEISAWLAEIETLFAIRARHQGLALEVKLVPAGPCWVTTDAGRLRQIVVNLLGNALKFAPRGSVRLAVEATPVDGDRVSLRISVSDTGPGIPPELQARLFQPYVQLEHPAQAQTPGTGLGLSISRRLAGLLGGELGLRSEVGAGAEFFFTLTLPRAAAVESPKRATGAAAPRYRILAADDNAANREVLRAVLTPLARELEVVASGAEAVERLARESYDLALIDLEMPEFDGMSVARTVRNWSGTEASRDCRLVALSAHRAEERAPDCLAGGFDAYLEKPIDRRALADVLHRPAGELARR